RLMLDVPSAETLRACARVVRAEAGAALLGICVFRLPGADDATTLTLGEVAAALSDASPIMATDVALARLTDDQSRTEHLLLTARNSGAASALMGDDAVLIEVHVLAGRGRRV